MRLIPTLFAAFAVATANTAAESVQPVNGCVSFTVSSGTGCAWMCNYCSGALGTNNYYFTTDVCKYQEGAGCVGNPQAGVTYTCCAAAGEAASGEEAEEESCDEAATEAPAEAEWDEEITEIRITEIRRRAV